MIPAGTINRTRPVSAGSRSYTGRAIPADIAEQHARLTQLAELARDPAVRALYLDRRHRLLRNLGRG